MPLLDDHKSSGVINGGCASSKNSGNAIPCLYSLCFLLLVCRWKNHKTCRVVGAPSGRCVRSGDEEASTHLGAQQVPPASPVMVMGDITEYNSLTWAQEAAWVAATKSTFFFPFYPFMATGEFPSQYKDFEDRPHSRFRLHDETRKKKKEIHRKRIPPDLRMPRRWLFFLQLRNEPVFCTRSVLVGGWVWGCGWKRW